MKYIDYRARIGVDEFAPVDAYEYAKEQLRLQILYDNKFQEEVIRNNDKLKDYVSSRLDGLEKHLEVLRKTPFLTAWIKGRALNVEITETSYRIDGMKGIIDYINYQNKALKHQLNRIADNNINK